MKKTTNLVRKSIETIKAESELLWNSLEVLQKQPIESFVESEIDRHIKSNLVKGTRSNKALELVNAITTNKDKLRGIENLDLISKKLEKLVSTINFLNSNKESMVEISKLIGYNFKLVNLNWNSEKQENKPI